MMELKLDYYTKQSLLKHISHAIHGEDFEPSIRDVTARLDYLNKFLEKRRKYLEDKYMGSEEEYAIGDVINLLDLIKNTLIKTKENERSKN